MTLRIIPIRNEFLFYAAVTPGASRLYRYQNGFDGRARHSVRAANAEKRPNTGPSRVVGGAHGVTRPTIQSKLQTGTIKMRPVAPIQLIVNPFAEEEELAIRIPEDRAIVEQGNAGV